MNPFERFPSSFRPSPGSSEPQPAPSAPEQRQPAEQEAVPPPPDQRPPAVEQPVEAPSEPASEAASEELPPPEISSHDEEPLDVLPVAEVPPQESSRDILNHYWDRITDNNRPFQEALAEGHTLRAMAAYIDASGKNAVLLGSGASELAGRGLARMAQELRQEGQWLAFGNQPAREGMDDSLAKKMAVYFPKQRRSPIGLGRRVVGASFEVQSHVLNKLGKLLGRFGRGLSRWV